MTNSASDRIDLAEIRQLSERLFEALDRAGYAQIRVPQRHYSTVFSVDAFRSDAAEIVVGDVFDDLEDLRHEDWAGANAGPVIWHAANHLAGLFKLMASADAEGNLIRAETR